MTNTNLILKMYDYLLETRCSNVLNLVLFYFVFIYLFLVIMTATLTRATSTFTLYLLVLMTPNFQAFF